MKLEHRLVLGTRRKTRNWKTEKQHNIVNINEKLFDKTINKKLIFNISMKRKRRYKIPISETK